MKPQSSKTVLFAAVFFSCIALSACGQAPQTDNVQDGVLVHVTHGPDNPHRLLMALKMAVTMAEAGKDVLVYCDIDAVRVLVADSQPVAFEMFPSSDELLNRLSTLKVQVLACPTCMKVANIEPGDLRAGVSVAQKDLFFSFTKGRILSLDY